MKKPRQARKHRARPDDAIALAAFRNFAIDIERLLVRIYVTHPEKYEDMVALMRKTIGGIYAAGTEADLRDQARTARGDERRLLSEENCPPGYELCSDGLCAEICDVYDGEARWKKA